MDHALGAVDHGQGIVCLGQGQQLRQRLPGTEHIGQLADGQQPGARADQAGRGVEIDQAVVVQWQDHQVEAATVCQLLPGQQVGVMLQGADDDFIARVELVFRP